MEGNDPQSVFQMWNDQLMERDLHNWRQTVYETMCCKGLMNNYMDIQKMAVYVNFVNCVYRVGRPEDNKKWDAGILPSG